MREGKGGREGSEGKGGREGSEGKGEKGVRGRE